jgi:hypothetical protein
MLAAAQHGQVEGDRKEQGSAGTVTASMLLSVSCEACPIPEQPLHSSCVGDHNTATLPPFSPRYACLTSSNSSRRCAHAMPGGTPAS